MFAFAAPIIGPWEVAGLRLAAPRADCFAVAGGTEMIEVLLAVTTIALVMMSVGSLGRALPRRQPVRAVVPVVTRQSRRWPR